MRCTSHSGEPLRWESTAWHESGEFPGVRYEVARPSLMRRAELTRRVRDLVERAQCHAASESPEERLSATILQLEADRVYVEWGLVSIEGLLIDGVAATTEALLDRGPEALCREIAERVRRESALSEDERKN